MAGAVILAAAAAAALLNVTSPLGLGSESGPAPPLQQPTRSNLAYLQTSANSDSTGVYAVSIAHLLRSPGPTELRFRITGTPSQPDAEHVWGASNSADPAKRPVLLVDGRPRRVSGAAPGGVLSSTKGFSLAVDLDELPRTAEIVLHEAGVERGSLTLAIEARQL